VGANRRAAARPPCGRFVISLEDIVEGLSIEGREVLDLGCGIGGASAVLAGELGAARVLGIDVEPDSVHQAASLIEDAGLAERVSLELVAPGPLPLPDRAFDAIFTKDVRRRRQPRDPGQPAGLR
jgi:phosphoethanolamine N-methyltransferase